MNLASDGGPALRDIPRQGPIGSLPFRVGTHGPLASPKLSPVGRENGVWSWSPNVTGWMDKIPEDPVWNKKFGPLDRDRREASEPIHRSRELWIPCPDQGVSL